MSLVIRDQAWGAMVLQRTSYFAPSLETVLLKPTIPFLAGEKEHFIQNCICIYKYLRSSWLVQSFRRDQRGMMSSQSYRFITTSKGSFTHLRHTLITQQLVLSLQNTQKCTCSTQCYSAYREHGSIKISLLSNVL